MPRIGIFEQTLPIEAPKPTSFGLVLVGPLCNVYEAEPIWVTPTKFRLPHDDGFDPVVTAEVWRVRADCSDKIPAKETSVLEIDKPCAAKRVPLALMAAQGDSLLRYSINVKKAHFSQDGVHSVELESPLPPPSASAPYDRLSLVSSFGRETFTPTKDGPHYVIDWGLPAPFAPVPIKATVAYRSAKSDVPCARIARGSVPSGSNPVLDVVFRLPNLSQLLFVNTNADTSGALRYLDPHDYYFVSTDGGGESRRVIKDLTSGRDFYQTFEWPIINEVERLAAFVV